MICQRLDTNYGQLVLYDQAERHVFDSFIQLSRAEQKAKAKNEGEHIAIEQQGMTLITTLVILFVFPPKKKREEEKENK